jgi:hypothetical protein
MLAHKLEKSDAGRPVPVTIDAGTKPDLRAASMKMEFVFAICAALSMGAGQIAKYEQADVSTPAREAHASPKRIGALRNIHATLADGGTAIILVPFGPKLYGTLDEVLGHCRRYTEEQLANAAQQAGFQVEKILKFNRPGVPAWWLNGKLLKRRTFGIGQIRVLNVLTPIFCLIDPWLPLPPLSIIAILRKWDRQDRMLAFNTKAAS